ncbi:THUMP domain-containing protein 3-like protein, partial [Euroglyphus maynei]
RLNEITYEATVTTGLESLAKLEIRKKIADCSDINHTNGHIIFRTKRGYDEISKLCSIDNIFVVIYDDYHPNLIDMDLETLYREIFISVIEKCDWKTGMAVWKEAMKFVGDIDALLDLDDKSAIPSFRASCNRNGEHKFTSQDAAHRFGGLIHDRFQWKVSLKQYDLEVVLNIKNNSLRILLCLTKESLSKRHIVSFGLTTLRGTIAYNLIQIANVQPGEIVCDPLCGSGVIPVECSKNWPDNFIIAADLFETAIDKTRTNFDANDLFKRTGLLRCDSTQLPLRDNTIDVFVTDLPFGKRMGNKMNNTRLYPLLITEMIRCSRIGSARIVILTQDKLNANKTINNRMAKKYCKFEKAYHVNIGGLNASVYLLKRNGQSFNE